MTFTNPEPLRVRGEIRKCPHDNFFFIAVHLVKSGVFSEAEDVFVSGTTAKLD